MKATHDRPRCAMCGKLIRPHTNRVYAPREPNSLRTIRNWRYDGNQQIVTRDYDHLLVSQDGKDWINRDKARPGGDSNEYYEGLGWKYEKRLRSVTVWDGESYSPVDGFFCTHTCSGNFAQAAHRAGYRIKRK